MILQVPYFQLSSYISAKFNKQVEFTQVSEKELKITYRQNVLIGSIPIPFTVIVDKVAATEVTLSYRGGKPVRAILNAILEFVIPLFMLPKEAIRFTDDQSITVDLREIPQARSAVRNIALQSISFDSTLINISFLLLV